MNEKNKQPEGGLLQSKQWTDVLHAEGKKIIEISSGGKKFFGVENSLPLVGTYAYFPRITNIDSKFVSDVFGLGYAWVRFDAVNGFDLASLTGQKIIKAPHDMQPKDHLIIDITKSEDELLAQMKGKTRYNIRLATKKGVKIFATKEKKYIDAFFDLVEDTAKRKDVSFHDRGHYEKIVNILPEEAIDIYIAEYKGNVVAANLVSFYEGVATYLHGATADKYRNVMAPFLLQWHVIKDAKRRNCRWYDLGGVFPNSSDPGRQGITRFKKGFAPKEEFFTSPGSYDLIGSSWRYSLYKLIQKIRK